MALKWSYFLMKRKDEIIQSFNLIHFTNMLLELFNRLSLNFLIVLIDFLKNNHDRLIKLLVK